MVNNNPSKATETTNTFNSSVASSSSITTAEQDSWMKMVYQAFVAAGLNPNQSKILTAEVGRENAFDPNYLFGGHSDPKSGHCYCQSLHTASCNRSCLIRTGRRLS